MKLTEVVTEIHKLEKTREELRLELEETEKKLIKYGTAVFSAVRHMSDVNTGRIEFQLDGSQYAILNSGELNRINELAAADDKLEIEL